MKIKNLMAQLINLAFKIKNNITNRLRSENMILTNLSHKKEIRDKIEYEIYFNEAFNFQYKVDLRKRIYLECVDCKIENPMHEITNGHKNVETSIKKHFKLMQAIQTNAKCMKCGKEYGLKTKQEEK